MKQITLSELRDSLPTVFGQTEHANARITVTSYGRPVGAVIGLADFELLQKLEDKADLELVRAALDESDERIDFDDLRKDLGI